MAAAPNRRPPRVFLVATMVLLAVALRVWAAWALPVEGWDERKYLMAASEYAPFVAARDLTGVVDYVGNLEHPALPKLLFGTAMVISGAMPTPQQIESDAPGTEQARFASRLVSVILRAPNKTSAGGSSSR